MLFVIRHGLGWEGPGAGHGIPLSGSDAEHRWANAKNARAVKVSMGKPCTCLEWFICGWVVGVPLSLATVQDVGGIRGGQRVDCQA